MIPNRSANISLINYADGEKRYILSPVGLKVDDPVISGEKVPLKVGNCLSLKNIPAGIFVHNIELIPGKGGQLVRSRLVLLHKLWLMMVDYVH